MPKRMLSLILLAAALAVFGGLAARTAHQPRLSDLYVDQTAWDQIIAARTAHDFFEYESIYTSIRFNGYEVFCDGMGGMMLYSLLEDHPDAYDPYVDMYWEHGDVHMAVMGQAITDEMIMSNGAIQVLVYNDEEYGLFDLRCTTLPVMAIDRNPALISTSSRNTTMRLFDNRQEAVNHVVSTDISIHVRGHGSILQQYPKSSYRISLLNYSAGNNLRKNHIGLLGLRTDEDWVINALYTDQERIREVFSTNLWYDSCAANNQWNIQNGMQYRYIEVFFDGKYWGVYALGSPIDAKQVSLGSGEHLYKKDNPTFSEGEIDFDETGAVGGYEYHGGDLANPDWEPLRRYYRVVMQGAQADTAALYGAADVDNSIDLFLFLNLIQGIDHAHVRGQNTVYNLFIAAKKTAEGSTVILYTPWDQDRTWGMDFDNKYTLLPDENIIMDSCIVTCLLAKGDEEIRHRLANRYAELRSTHWSDQNMLGRVEQFENTLFASGAYAREADRWMKEQGVAPADSLDRFADYMLKRLEAMDAYVQSII